MSTTPHRIDVHHHVLPAEYLRAVARHGYTGGGDIAFPQWNVEQALELMDRNGIATAITSMSLPGVSFGDAAEARTLARRINEIQADLMRDHPKRFGAFATLPVPDVDGALAELEYALDTLGFDGVVMLARIGEQYLGDAALEPLMAELNRRKTVVFVHPNIPLTSQKLKLALPAALVEFVFDTTRAVANLIFSGTLERYPDIKFILSHAGGTVPFLTGRLSTARVIPPLHAKAPQGAVAYLKRLYYDTAISGNAQALSALRALVGPSQILFGSDYPFLPEPEIREQVRGIDGFAGFDAADRRAVERESALALFPRFRA
jgi:predicted TIM-barrel fold metal-dependent hydrolase